MSETEPSIDDVRRSLTYFVGLKRKQNPFVKTAYIREAMAERGFSPEDLGTTDGELKTFHVEDCRYQVECDLANWRLTASIGHPEACFAEGILENLKGGGFEPAAFGIDDLEFRRIRNTPGLK